MCRRGSKPLSAVLAAALRDHPLPHPTHPSSTPLPNPILPQPAADSFIAMVNRFDIPPPMAAPTAPSSKHVHRNTQSRRFNRLVKLCFESIGSDAAMEVFGRLGSETGVKEYNALISLCVERARGSRDEEELLRLVWRVHRLLRLMRERGLPLGEESYGPLLLCLIDLEMEQEFHFFVKFIKDESLGSLPRLGYYEMLLWIRLGEEGKIQELCSSVEVDGDEKGFSLALSYLLALCENDREKEVLRLIDVVQVARISSIILLEEVFKSLGRRASERSMEELVHALKKTEIGAKQVSVLLFHYLTSIPGLEVDEVMSMFKYLHSKLEVQPLVEATTMIIRYCCSSQKVHAALDVVDYMCLSGLELSVDLFQPILDASEQASNMHLVHPIYEAIRRHGLTVKEETIKSIIRMLVKMKDFKGAYEILNILEEIELKPTAAMYNAIMAGYCKNNIRDRAYLLLEQMKRENVEPDSETYSYLISKCKSEEEIDKLKQEVKASKISFSKQIYMELINAYANCGLFEKAKQVMLDKNLPVKNMSEIRSVLLSAFACNGRVPEAIKMYSSFQQNECEIQPKAILSLIENIKSREELDSILELLGQLKDSCFWFEGCCRAVVLSVRHKQLRYAVDLLKQLKEKDELSTRALFPKIYNSILGMEPVDLDIGMALLQVMKKELLLKPCRTSLDFLLSSCVSARDLSCARSIWKEYEEACLPHNVSSYLRMYQVMLATGEQESAAGMLKWIPTKDPHVRDIVKACKSAFNTVHSNRGERTKIGNNQNGK